MIVPAPDATIGDTFFRCAEAFGDNAFLAVPANPARSYHPDGVELSYAAAAQAVRALMQAYADAGYGVGHRVALLLENRPEHLLHKLAMNALGICCVPLNADHRPREMAYVLEHAKVDLVVVADELQALLRAAIEASAHKPQVVRLDAFDTELPTTRRRGAEHHARSRHARQRALHLGHHRPAQGLRAVAPLRARSRPLVCQRGWPGQLRRRHRSPLQPAAAVPRQRVDPLLLLRDAARQLPGADRPLQPRALVDGGTAVARHRRALPGRGGADAAGASRLSPLERGHRVRFAIGAGVDPQRHAEFEQRFGFPLIEIWGMTEMVRATFDNQAPRQVGTRVFGRAMPGLDVRVVDDQDRDVPDGTPGEMLIRHSAATPRKDFFSGYLDDPAATELAWRGGWFHTGDIVTRAPDGLLRFVDRRKNIIRRSGENIAAAEVEAVLQAHPWVEQAAVLAVPDDLREEEVLACVVLREAGRADPAAAIDALFAHCNARTGLLQGAGLGLDHGPHSHHLDAEDPEAPDLRARQRPAHAARHGGPARAQETRPEGDTMSDDPVLTRREGAVGVMTFNRADKLNALNMPMMLAIEAALGTLEADPQVRCIVFTGADDRAFMAGGDIADLATRRPASWYDEFGPTVHRVFRRIETCDKPTLAAVNGWALGGGMELMLCTDLRLMAAEAKIGLPEIKLGLFPGGGGSQRLMRQIPLCQAKKLMFTGDSPERGAGAGAGPGQRGAAARRADGCRDGAGRARGQHVGADAEAAEARHAARRRDAAGKRTGLRTRDARHRLRPPRRARRLHGLPGQAAGTLPGHLTRPRGLAAQAIHLRHSATWGRRLARVDPRT